MKWIDIFKSYNMQKIKKNKIVGGFIIISIILAVSISLTIPQVSSTLDKSWKKQAYEQNGADLKVEMNFDSTKFDEKLKEIQGIDETKEVLEFASSVKKGDKQTFSDVLLGNYDLDSDEIILSNNVAEVLKVSKGSNVKVFENKYKVKDIEDNITAVGEQGGQMGYVKVSKLNVDMKKAYGKLIFINSNNIEKVRKELIKAEDKFTYTTVSDIEEQIDEKVNSNTMALSILNTMSIIMTIMSLISSIFLLITSSSKEIAIMKITGIDCKKIKKAFQFQFYCYMVPAIIVGAILSMFLTRFIIKMNEIVYEIDLMNVKQMIIGAILFTIIYIIYINIACDLIKKIDPLTVIKVAEEKIRRKKIIILSIIFTFISLIAYAKYVGSENVISGSLVIIVLIAVFFIISLILISIVTSIKSKNAINKYYRCHMKEKRNSIILTILSLSFTIIFFLIGFTLSKTIGDSFDQGLKSKIKYNYMITSSDSSNVENKLLQNDETGKYTKLYRHNVLFYHKDKVDRVANICGIDISNYQVKFKILEGVDLFEGNKKEVLISSKIANELDLAVKDTIKINIEGNDYNYKIKGIYEAGTINTDDILIQKDSLTTEYDNILYLASIKSSKIVDKLTNVSLVGVQSIGNSLEKSMNNALKIFKALCFICIISSIVFNINTIYMNSLKDFREFVLIRALSLGKGVLYKNIIVEMITILVMTFIMSLGIYFIMLKLAMKMMFGASVLLTAKMILVPILISLIIMIVIFLIPFSLVSKSSSFEKLKELD